MIRNPHLAGLAHQRLAAEVPCSVVQALSISQTEALEEARIVVEQIVMPRQQPVELLPRSPSVLQLQVCTHSQAVRQSDSQTYIKCVDSDATSAACGAPPTHALSAKAAGAHKQIESQTQRHTETLTDRLPATQTDT